MEYVHAVIDEFINFIGGRAGILHWGIFALALICCFFMGKREQKLLFWPSVLVLVFFFNPLFYKYVGTRFLSGVYWRLLWMLPIAFVIAYTLTQVTFRFSKTAVRVLVVGIACLCIVLTGERIFSKGTYSERENDYELPQAAIEICNYVDGRLMDWKETIIVPNELLCSIRQYSASTCLLYGRNYGGFISDIGEEENAVYEEMTKEVPDVALITEVAREKNCRYIVFNTSFHQIPEDLTEYGYEKATVIEDVYAVYSRSDEN